MKNYDNYVNCHKLLMEVKSMAVSKQMYEFCAYIREIERKYYHRRVYNNQYKWYDFSPHWDPNSLIGSEWENKINDFDLSPMRLESLLTINDGIKDMVTLTFRKWKLSQI